MDDGSPDDVDPITTDVPSEDAQQTAATILLAPCVIGWVLALFLAGYVLCTFLAYRSSSLYAADRRPVKVAVWVVTLCVLAAAAINANETYHYLVSQDRDYDSLANFTAADCLPALPQGIVQAFVQVTLGERACGLIRDRRWRLAARITLFALVGIAVFWSWMDVILSFVERAGLDDLFLPLTLNIADAVWYFLSATVDIAIFTVLIVDFRAKLKMSAGRRATDDVLRHLILLSMWTTSTTALVAVGAAVTSALATNPSDVYIDVMSPFSSVLPSLYALALFTTLNARDRLRDRLQGGGRCRCSERDVGISFESFTRPVGAYLSSAAGRSGRLAIGRKRRSLGHAGAGGVSKGKARGAEKVRFSDAGVGMTSEAAAYNSFASVEEELESGASSNGGGHNGPKGVAAPPPPRKKVVTRTAAGGITVSVLVEEDGGGEPWRPQLGLDPGDGSYWATVDAGGERNVPGPRDGSVYSPVLVRGEGAFGSLGAESRRTEDEGAEEKIPKEA